LISTNVTDVDIVPDLEEAVSMVYFAEDKGDGSSGSRYLLLRNRGMYYIFSYDLNTSQKTVTFKKIREFKCRFGGLSTPLHSCVTHNLSKDLYMFNHRNLLVVKFSQNGEAEIKVVENTYFSAVSLYSNDIRYTVSRDPTKISN